VRDADVDNIRSIFEKWFSNKVRAIHFDQAGAWEQPVKVAARVDLTGWDTKRLTFYAYDPKTNSCKRIEEPAYWIDKNEYPFLSIQYINSGR